MKRVHYFEMFAKLFEYKTVVDQAGNEYVFFADTPFASVTDVKDKTEFEALETHVHLLDNITKEEFGKLTSAARSIGAVVLHSLQTHFPQKRFVVYVSLKLHGSMILRFHQIWENEEPYYNVSQWNSDTEKVYEFHSDAVQ